MQEKFAVPPAPMSSPSIPRESGQRSAASCHPDAPRGDPAPSAQPAHRLDLEQRARTALLLSTSLAGCSNGAPTLEVAGAFFPAWLACALVGVVAAVVTRIVCVATGLGHEFPWPLLVCASVGVITAALVWLAWVGV